MLYIYKILNPSPQGTEFAPGIRMTLNEKVGDKWVKRHEVIDDLRAVILFNSSIRALRTGMGKTFRTLCSSDDGVSPSLKIESPLCRKATMQDLAQIMSQWKNMSKARVDAQIAEVTAGSGNLQICGLKTKNGTIALCPYARKDPITKQAGPCKESMLLFGYDIKRQREFYFDLTIANLGKIKDSVSPLRDFYQFIQKENKPCYAYTVNFKPLKQGKFYILGVDNIKPIENPDNFTKMEAMANQRRDTYLKRGEVKPPEAPLAAANPDESEVRVNIKESLDPFDMGV